MVTEFQYIRAHSVEPLSTFMDLVSVEYQIDNVMLLLKGTLSGRDVNELIEQCHPLGMFKESTMRLVTTFDNTPKGHADLYQMVLVETSVGKYFEQVLRYKSDKMESAAEVRMTLDEVETLIRRVQRNAVRDRKQVLAKVRARATACARGRAGCCPRGSGRVCCGSGAILPTPLVDETSSGGVAA